MSPDSTTQKIQDVSLQTLLKLREEDNSLTFQLRQKPKSDMSLENGYWLPGGKHQVTINFWHGQVGNKEVPLISFVITDSKESSLRLNNHGSKEASRLFEAIMRRLEGDFAQVGTKNVWQKTYDGSFFRRTLEKFVRNEKPLIDTIIRERQPECLGFFDTETFEQELENVLQIRNELLGEPADAEPAQQPEAEPAVSA